VRLAFPLAAGKPPATIKPLLLRTLLNLQIFQKRMKVPPLRT
jgi:hypothetical protein